MHVFGSHLTEEHVKKCPVAAISGVIWLLLCSLAFGGEGVFLLGNDALQLGRASSGVASPRSAYWSYMNPASMVDLERRFDINWYTVFSDITFEPKGIIGNRLDGELKSDGIFNIVSSGMIWPLESGAIGGGRRAHRTSNASTTCCCVG